MHSEEVDRRERILRAAAVEFAAKGFAGARTAEIAKRASANKQLIFYYFGSKRGLYEAVIEEAGRYLTPRPASGEPNRASRGPAERIRQLLRSVYGSLKSQPQLAGLLVHGVGDRRDASDLVRGFVRDLADRVAALVSEGQGLGYFRDDVDPELAGRQAAVLTLGYLVLEASWPIGPVQRHRADWLEQASDLLISSLTW